MLTNLVQCCRSQFSHLGHLRWQMVPDSAGPRGSGADKQRASLYTALLLSLPWSPCLFTSRMTPAVWFSSFHPLGGQVGDKGNCPQGSSVDIKSLSPSGFLNLQLCFFFFFDLQSIEIAHTNMKRGRILINKGNVDGAQINRSPYSYLQNPQSERARWGGNHQNEIVCFLWETATKSKNRIVTGWIWWDPKEY